MLLLNCGDPTGYLYVLQPSFYSGWKGVKTRFFVQVKSKLMGLIEYKQKNTNAFFFLLRSNYVHENDLNLDLDFNYDLFFALSCYEMTSKFSILQRALF